MYGRHNFVIASLRAVTWPFILAPSMQTTPAQFLKFPTREPHRERTKTLLRNHAELRGLIGNNPITALIILGCVCLQVGLACALRDASWWLILLTAFIIGACASHALWTLIHECAHNLIFARTYLNTLASMIANLPHLVPAAVSFQRYHLKHHAFQGVYELDADLPSYWEARLIGNSAARKALWLLLFPIFQVTRPPRLREIRGFDRWIVLNFLLQVAFDGAIYMFFGPKTFLYLGASFFFSVGLHPLGARWIQEHYVLARRRRPIATMAPPIWWPSTWDTTTSITTFRRCRGAVFRTSESVLRRCTIRWFTTVLGRGFC